VNMSSTIVNLASQLREQVLEDFMSHVKASIKNSDVVANDTEIQEQIIALINSYLNIELKEPVTSESKIVETPKKKKRGRKKKIQEEESNFSRMPEKVEGKCRARTYANGLGFQCSSKCGEQGLCKKHSKTLAENGKPAFGFIDEPRCCNRHDTGKNCVWKHFVPSTEDPNIEKLDNLEEDNGIGTQICQVIRTIEENPEEQTLKLELAEEEQDKQSVEEEQDKQPKEKNKEEQQEDEDLENGEFIVGKSYKVNYQGLEYYLKPNDDIWFIYIVDESTTTLKVVGEFEGEIMCFNDEYEKTHEMNQVNEDEEIKII